VVPASRSSFLDEQMPLGKRIKVALNCKTSVPAGQVEAASD
jgi:hypothetical protein